MTPQAAFRQERWYALFLSSSWTPISNTIPLFLLMQTDESDNEKLSIARQLCDKAFHQAQSSSSRGVTETEKDLRSTVETEIEGQPKASGNEKQSRPYDSYDDFLEGEEVQGERDKVPANEEGTERVSGEKCIAV